jgi:hypothetical protein
MKSQPLGTMRCDNPSEPSSHIYTLWEREGAWTDSLGTLQADRNFSAGRIATGIKLLAPWQMSGSTRILPYVGLYGDWRFSTDNALPVGTATPPSCAASRHRSPAIVVGSLSMPDVKASLAAMAYEPIGNSSEECTEFFKAEMAKWSKVIRASGLHAD